MPKKKAKRATPKASKSAKTKRKKAVAGKAAKPSRGAKKGRARHDNFGALKKGVFLKAIARGCSRTKACLAAGVSRTTFYNEMKRDPDFSEEVTAHESMATDAVEEAMWQSAIKGNTTAGIFWLKNKRPEVWKDRMAAPHEPPKSSDTIGATYRDALVNLNDVAREAIEREQRAQLAAGYPEAVRQAIERGDMVGRAAPEGRQRSDHQAGIKKGSGLHLVRRDDAERRQA